MNKQKFIIITVLIHSISFSMQLQDPHVILAQKDNFNFKQCMTLEHIALKLDAIHRETKDLTHATNVETAYIKAVKCFLEEYEKNNKEALLHVIKMWMLLLQIEQEKKAQDMQYQMPSVIKGLAAKIRALWKPCAREKSFSLKTLEKATESKSETSEQILQRFSNLKRSFDTLMPYITETESGSEIDNHNFKHGSLLYDQATQALAFDQKTKQITQIEDLFTNAENLYIQALGCFINAYQENYFNAFSEIRSSVKNIQYIEEARKIIEEDTYSIHKGYLNLQESLIHIKEKEKIRRAEKKIG